MHTYKWLLVLLALTASNASNASKPPAWAELQYGASSASDRTTVGFKLSGKKDNRVTSLGITAACVLFCSRSVYYSDLYASYGIIKQLNSNLTLTRQIGVSVFRRLDQSCDEDCDQRALGIPLDIALMATGKYTGLGLNLRVNFNDIETTTTLTLSFALGTMR